MLETINGYGDKRIATSSGHGIDVSSQRMDDLDQHAVEYILTHENLAHEHYFQHVHALDAGCGFGGQAARMARAGASVTAMDVHDYAGEVLQSMMVHGVSLEGRFQFVQASVEEEPKLSWSHHSLKPERFDLIMCQRMIHYLKYESALKAVKWFYEIAQRHGKLYLSASGLESELGDGYAYRDYPIEDRFTGLSPVMARKHSIYPPVCLYRQSELEEMVSMAGWVVDNAFLSPFGNVKLIASKK